MSVTAIAASSSATTTIKDGLAYPPFAEGDKYRGAVVEVRLFRFVHDYL